MVPLHDYLVDFGYVQYIFMLSLFKFQHEKKNGKWYLLIYQLY